MLPRKGGRAGWDRAQPPDVASGFEDGDDAKSLLGLGGKGYLYSYVPYCRLAFGFFQSKRPSRIGFGGADLGVLGRLECRFFMLAWGAKFRPQKTSQLAAAMVRLCRAECTLARRRAGLRDVGDARGQAKRRQHLAEWGTARVGQDEGGGMYRHKGFLERDVGCVALARRQPPCAGCVGEWESGRVN